MHHHPCASGSPRRLAALAVMAAATALSGPALGAPDTTRVIVAFKPGTAASVHGAVAAARGSVKLEIFGLNAMAVEVPTRALAGLQRNPNVEYVEEDAKRHPYAGTAPSQAPYTAGQFEPYGIRMVQADQLFNVNASNRKVCIIDSGYWLGHEDLPGLTNVTGENDSGTGSWMVDQSHHGTHVAGTIAALNNSLGVVGVSANNTLKLHIVKVFGDDGTWTYSSTLVNAANKCAAAGANVISMSLGGSFKSKTEDNAFKALLANNVLPIAAAGNAGNRTVSYPAGYTSVMSVAAVDQVRQWATFSQYNNDVEIAGPGVNVLSTVEPGSGSDSNLSVVGGGAFDPGDMEGSPKASVTAPLFDFGIGSATNAGANGKVCLIARGTVDFATKVSNCQASGGVGAVIYNNVAGGFAGTLGETVTVIPSVTASQAEGTALQTLVGNSATVSVEASNYAFFDGTSMATPHVSAVAALVWSTRTTCTAAQIRATLQKSAVDLGPAGRDTKFGFGLVQAKAAADRLATGCNN
jgi:subtilisin family serine protease